MFRVCRLYVTITGKLQSQDAFINLTGSWPSLTTQVVVFDHQQWMLPRPPHWTQLRHKVTHLADNTESLLLQILVSTNLSARQPTAAQSAINRGNRQDLIIWKTGNMYGEKVRPEVHYNSYTNWKTAMMGLEPVLFT